MEGKKIIRRVNSYGNIQYNRREYFIGEEEIGTEVELIVNRGIAVMARQAGRSWQRLVESPKSAFKPIKKRMHKVTVNEDSLYKLLSITDKALKQTDRNTVLLVDNNAAIIEIKNSLTDVQEKLLVMRKRYDASIEYKKRILSLLTENKWQVRTTIESSASEIGVLRKEIQEIRATQSHKGFHFFLLNASNIKAWIVFLKRMLNFSNLFQRFLQIRSGSSNRTNQPFTNSLDNIEGNGTFPVLNEVSKTESTDSPTTKINNGLCNIIHKTQNTKSQAKRKSKKPFIGGNN